MSTFTIRVTSSATNTAGTAYGQQPDLGAPSFFDMIVSNSTDPMLPNGVYDAYCLNPLQNILLSPTPHTASSLAGNTAASYVPIGFSSVTQVQVDQINWLLSQNFTSDPKYGGQFNYGEVQTAIWKLVGFTDAQIASAGYDRFLNDNNRNVVSSADINFLIQSAQNAIASGNDVVPTDTYFAAIIDPTGTTQPLIVQLQNAKLGNFVWADTDADGIQDGGETGINNVIVELYDANGVLIASTVTGDDFSTAAVEQGYYQFTGLKAGDYQVKFIAQSGQFFSQQDANGNTLDATDSDADVSSGYSHVINLSVGESDQTIDAGLYQKASLGDYVWVDSDNDGQQNDGNTGVNGVEVNLYKGDGTFVGTTTTANNPDNGNPGWYLFDGLVPGDYKVEFIKPAGYAFAKQNLGADGSDSDADSSGMTQTVTLVSGDNNLTLDAGLVELASLGDRLWVDSDGDGIQNDGATGIVGRTVTLIGGGADGVIGTGGDDTSASTVTGADGYYEFTGLNVGEEYQVQFGDIPAGMVFTQQNIGSDSADSDADADAAGKTPIVTLASGEHNPTLDAGVYAPVSLGDKVFEDKDADGKQDNDEPGIDGVKVHLYNCVTNQLITSTTTANGGLYNFSDLPPGTYHVVFETPSGFVETTANVGDDAADSDAVGGITGCYTLNSGESTDTVDAGYYRLASLGDYVWVDSDNDGQQNDGNTGVNGVEVNLYKGDGTFVGTTTTANNPDNGNPGWYLFTGLVPGDYKVEFIKPAGYVFAKQNLGADGSDSDADSSGMTQTVTLVSGDNNLTLDAGLVELASLGDRLWVDSDGDGIQNDGATGIVGRTVTLIGGGADGVIGTGGDDTSASTVTGADGYYEFTGLNVGEEYQVQFGDIPAGMVFTQQNIGSDSADSDADAAGKTPIVTLASGEHNPTLDAGVYAPVSLGDKVFEDKDADGKQDNDEPGIDGVKVHLYNCITNQLIDSTTTANGGIYNFSDLPPGTYHVVFETPAGFVETTANVGDDAADSDAVGGITGCYTLNSGESTDTVDAGYYRLASLGDYVWVDSDNDGQQNDGNTGVNGVEVNLYKGDGTFVGTTTTANNPDNGNPGWYLFTGLVPGDYKVEFIKPAGYVFAKQNLGADGSDSDADSSGMTQTVTLVSGDNNLTLDAGLVELASLGDRLWVDSDGDGIQNDGATGIVGRTVTLIGGGADGVIGTGGDDTSASTVTGADGYYEFTGLNVGEEYQVQFGDIPAGMVFTQQNIGSDSADSDADASGKTQIVTLASGEHNPTLDAGVYAPVSLGDKVFEDKDADGKQDNDEPGIDGVKVHLYNCVTNQLITSTTTANGGLYNFSDLPPGTYHVVFETPSGFVETTANVGDDAADSDAVGGITGCYTLNSGESTDTVDAGYYRLASLGDYVWLDSDNDGQQNDGNTGVNGVEVNLYKGDGTFVGTTTTANNPDNGNPGWYLFDGLVPGDYKVEFIKPAGYAFAKQNLGADGSDSDADGSGMTQTVTLVSGDNNLTLDAGLVLIAKSSIGDRVWLDCDADGIQDANEIGVAGVTVNLLNSSGAVIDTTTTDYLGNYLFDELTPGNYAVQVVKPDGYSYTARDQGGDDGKDSDVDTSTGKTVVTTLSPGENDMSWDAGLTTVGTCLDLELTGGANSGNSAGNIRTYTMNGLSVNSSAFSRTDAGGTWATAYLASYSGGLGVTDTSEDGATPNHAVDNVGGRDNYILLEFNKTVLLDKAFLGWVSGDSDIQVWIGNFNNPYNSHLTLSDSVLTSMGFMEVNTTTLSTTRWADLNAGDYAGNTIVIAADTTDTTPEDFFKLQTLSICTPSCGLTASIGDKVWCDADGDGVQDSNEAGVSGVTVKLLNAAGTVLATTTTNSDGEYLFSDLAPDDYAIQVVAPSGYTFTGKDQGGNDATDSDVDTSTGKTIVTTLSGGENDMTWDAGLVQQKASIGDRVWLDCDADGVQDANEIGVAGVTVNLLSSSGVLIDTTTTDYLGNYLFDELTPGDYAVQVVKPNGYSFTAKDQGNDDGKDSDVDASTGKTIVTTLTPDENDMSWDAGLTTVGACLDLELTGGSNSGECVGNIRTYTMNGLSVHASAFSRTDTGSNWATAYLASYSGGLGVTDTSEDGSTPNHAVDNVGGRDNYILLEFNKTVLLDKAFLGWVSGDSDLQVWIGNFNNPYNSHLTLSDSVLTSMGFMEINSTTLTTTRWADLNAGDYAGNTIVIAADSTDTSPEDFFKLQTLSICTPSCGLTASIGDKVWLDCDNDGVQDSNEAGVSGVTVKLLNAAGTVLATTTTNSAGEYLFSDLAPGDYAIQVVAPSGYTFTGKDLGGNDATDSDVDTSSGKTIVTTLSGGENDMTWDAGLKLVQTKASIGNKVWHDKDYDGIQDSNEAGIANVTVKLLNSAGTVLKTTTTNSVGEYLFSNLTPGDYKVQVVKPSGYYTTKQDQGANNDVDSDVNSSGYTALTTLVAGENDMSWDAGLYMKASVGDKVWDDMNHNNLQDSNEPGIANIKVVLKTSSGSTVATAYTDSNGNYKFTNLNPGDYYLVFDKTNVQHYNYGQWNNMSYWKWAKKDVGSNNAIDSDVTGDAISTTNVTQTSVFNLESGENDMSWDAGITPIAIDLNGDGLQTISRANANGSFDLLGNGKPIQSGWLSGEDGFLAVDANGNGQIDNINELFGGVNKGDGYAKLAAYDSNGDGMVDASDAAFADLRIWKDVDGDHQTDAGELLTLTEAGVASLSLDYQVLPLMDGNGNLHLERGSATLADGTVTDMTDIYFGISAADAADAGIELPSLGNLLGDDSSLDGLLAGLGGDAAEASVMAANADVYDSAAFDGMTQLAAMFDEQAAACCA